MAEAASEPSSRTVTGEGEAVRVAAPAARRECGDTRAYPCLWATVEACTRCGGDSEAVLLNAQPRKPSRAHTTSFRASKEPTSWSVAVAGRPA